MAAKWGLFLCNCHRTLSLDPERLVLPTVPSVLSFARDPETEAPKFASSVQSEGPDQVLISCCAGPGLFNQAINNGTAPSTKLRFVDLKGLCFQVHSDPAEAHAKANRLLCAAMETAEAETQVTYNPLNVGGRIVIATDSTQGIQFAEKLRDIAQTSFIIAPDVLPDLSPTLEVTRGRVLGVQGSLGGFRVTVETNDGPKRGHRDLQADQFVSISENDTPGIKRRTGCHLLVKPDRADLDELAMRVRDLIGDFVKPVQVAYNGDICAGGTADQKGCGICITSCPYDAISRDPQNHFRMQVDHMACEGCGACASACPTSSLRFTEPSPHELYTRLAALLGHRPGHSNGERLTVLFHCGEQGRRVLEEAGRRPLPYPASVFPVEVPCLRYVSEANILAAFRLGAAGVGLLGCETCQHGERELLYQKVDFCRLTLDAFGMGSERLRLMTADHGTEVEVVTALSSFAEKLDKAPIHWDGKRIDSWGNREVVADAIRTFIEQTGREPGRRALDPSQPFALADVESSGCTLCRSCVNVCPVHAFSIEEGKGSLRSKAIACVACGLCEKVCPENVITLRREIFFERDALDYQTVVEDPMVSCGKCGKPYINKKALETIETRLFSLESLMDTFSGNRRKLLRLCPDCRAAEAMLEVEKGWKP
ncbi:MAG: 4Fe-4S dicluster domain-containing protein [Candidatus Binatia bacterium]